MKVLLVEQFGKTVGRDSLGLSTEINKNEEIEISLYLSDDTEIPPNKVYNFKIEKGFKNAFKGGIFNKIKNYLKSLYILKKYIEKNNIEIVHLQWFVIPWIEWIYVRLLKPKCKIAITVHDVIPFNNRFLEMKALDLIYKQADVLFLHTDYAKKEFKKYYSAKTPIKIITQAFCNKSDYKKIDKIEARDYLNIPKDKVVFLFYGQIKNAKGLDVLIKAFAKEYNFNKDIYLLIGGRFQNVDEDYYKNLIKTYLNETNSKITFEFIPYNLERYYFSAADVLCLPYRELTQSGVAQLGLMYDLPMIATNIGTMSNVVRNKENGLLFEIDNEKECMQCIKIMAENISFRKKCEIISNKLSREEFSLEKKAKKIIEGYKFIFK
jgi:D-inositol-3-phosphate glycosyltransferase